MKAVNTRLLPLQTLYPKKKEKEPQKKVVPFVKPGVSAKIPTEQQNSDSIRYVQASLIKKNIMGLEANLKEIENDTTFVANAMAKSLQVPTAIESTFNRIHGRIYDIQREIEYSSNSLDDQALTIQSNFRRFKNQIHYEKIMNAVHRTMQRDCAAIHECLLGFLLSYSKTDDHLRILMNRRFLVRNRHALRFWREWSEQATIEDQKREAQIPQLQESWTRRQVAQFLRKWRDLSFSKHSRKAVRQLQQKIAAEAQRRLAETPGDQKLTILEQLAEQRVQVILDFAKQNYVYHMQSITFRWWRRFIEQCKNESRSGNAIAREFYVTRKKKTFFQAWYSLSVGRVNVFGGYSKWQRPVNMRIALYKDDCSLERIVVREWRLIVVRRKNMIAFREKSEREFLRRCLVQFHLAASDRRNRLAHMVETYIAILHGQMHRVFIAWHHCVVKNKVRRQPNDFLEKRYLLMREFRKKRTFFRRWAVRYTEHSTTRFDNFKNEVSTYVEHWESAGNEMKSSMVLISSLNEKLTTELAGRKTDLENSKRTVEFMKNEQLSLALAMKNAKAEIERLQELIGKSSMRYFVDIKPIHANVVENVPAALAAYIAQKEEEKQRLAAERAAQQAALIQKNQRPVNSGAKRRKTTFSGVKNGVSRNSQNRPTRKSLSTDQTTE